MASALKSLPKVAGVTGGTQYQAPGTRRMAELLAKIAEAADANPMDNPFWNNKRAEAIRSFLAQHGLDPKRELEMRMSLAKELLYGGQTEEAIDAFEAICSRADLLSAADDPDLANVLKYWLGLSYLRLGEQENCIHYHNIESCLLPIKGRGIHSRLKRSEYETDNGHGGTP